MVICFVQGFLEKLGSTSASHASVQANFPKVQEMHQFLPKTLGSIPQPVLHAVAWFPIVGWAGL